MEQTYSLRAVLEGDLTGTYLCHWGIRGMKWGQRRYQNPDGSLTALGKERYGTRKKYETHRAEVKAKRKARAIKVAKTVGKAVAVGAATTVPYFLLNAYKKPVLTLAAKVVTSVAAENTMSKYVPDSVLNTAVDKALASSDKYASVTWDTVIKKMF